MYLGTFDSFEFTASADTNVNSIVTSGGYVGVTRANVANGEKGLAFMGVPKSVYTFTVTALGANKNLGTAVYIDGDGDIDLVTTGKWGGPVILENKTRQPR